MTQWNIREKENHTVVLTNIFEIYIIELEKYKEQTNNKALDTWVKFLRNPEVINMEKASKEVRKAKEVLEEISQDERERYLAELRQKYVMDQKAIRDAGYDKGIEKGREEGKHEKAIEIAKNLKAMRISLEEIEKVTGLLKEEIERL